MKENHKFFVLGTNHDDINIALALQKMKKECDKRSIKLAVCFEGDFTIEDIIQRRVQSINDGQRTDFITSSNLGVLIQEKLLQESRSDELKAFLEGSIKDQKLLVEKVALEIALSGMNEYNKFVSKISDKLLRVSKQDLLNLYRDVSFITQLAFCKVNKIQYSGFENPSDVVKFTSQIEREDGKDALKNAYETSPEVERNRIRDMTEKYLEFSKKFDDVPTIFVAVIGAAHTNHLVSSLLRQTANVDSCWGAEMTLLEDSTQYLENIQAMQKRYKLCGILEQEIEKVEGAFAYDGDEENIPTEVIENFEKFLDRERSPNQRLLQTYFDALNQNRTLKEQVSGARMRKHFGTTKSGDDEIIRRAANPKIPEKTPLKDPADPDLLSPAQKAFYEMLREREAQAAAVAETQKPQEQPRNSPEPEEDEVFPLVNGNLQKLTECNIL